MAPELANETAIPAIEKWGNPAIVRANLIRAALLITAYETLREQITAPLVFFYAREWGVEPPVESDAYRQSVLKHHPRRFEASCLWLVEQGAITPEDLEAIHVCRHHRNAVVHELLKYLVDPVHEVSIDVLDETTRLHTKIDRWWVKEFEIPANEEFDGVEVQDEDIQSGTMLILQLIRAVALEATGRHSRPDP